VAYIVSGPLRQLPTLGQIINAQSEVARTPCSGVVTDEEGDQVVALLEQLGRRLLANIERDVRVPWTFLGKGGHMVFRDLVYERSGTLRADYRYYKNHGLFDYPQSNYRNRLTQTFLRAVARVPSLAAKLKLDPTKKMLEPFQKILAEA
jgi:hypothetical protein